MANSYYSTPEQYSGKTLSQIRDETNGSFRPDVLAAMLGINDKTALTSGQQLTLSSNDPGSGEQQALNKYFGQPMSEEQYQQDKYKKAVQPSVDTLKSQVDPLKERYNKVIADIQAQRGTAKQTASVSAAREFGARGVSTNSSAYDQYLQGQISPIDTQYGSLETSAAGEEQDRINAINTAIASLQTQAGLGGITAADAAKVAQEAARQFDAQNELAKQELELKKQQAKTPTQVANVAPGNTLFDLLNGKPLYTNPKSSASTSSGW